MENILEFFLLHREAIFIVILSIFLGIEVISNVLPYCILHLCRAPMPSMGWF